MDGLCMHPALSMQVNIERTRMPFLPLGVAATVAVLARLWLGFWAGCQAATTLLRYSLRSFCGSDSAGHLWTGLRTVERVETLCLSRHSMDQSP